MKFKNTRTGVILEPHSEAVIEQLKNNPEYVEVKPKKDKEEKKEEK